MQGIFPQNTSDGQIPGNHWKYGQQWIGETVVWSIAPGDRRKLLVVRPDIESKPGATKHTYVREQLAKLVNGLDLPFQGLSPLKVLSDRGL